MSFSHEPAPTSSADSFGRELAAWMTAMREAKGLSQESVAVQLGKDQPQVSRLERGQRRISLREFLEWADAVGLTWDEIEAGVRHAWEASGHRGSIWSGPAPNW